MKKNILFIFLVFCFNTYAQSKYKAGVIVRQNTDTINGFIYSGMNKKNCFFKKNLNDDPIQFEPSQLLSFQFYGGDKYMTIDHLDNNDNSVQSFALVLEEGHVNLYYHKNKYYVQKQKGNVLRLENDEIEVKTNDLIYKKKSQRYIGILSYILSDYPQLRPHILRIRYSGKEISKLINKYNSKFNSYEQQYKTKLPWHKIELGAYLSTSFSRLKFSINQKTLPNHLTNANWKFSQQVGCGFFLENRHTRVSKNTAIHIAANIQKISYSSSCEVSKGAIKYFYDNQINHYAVNIPLGIKYYHSYRNMKAYIMGGPFYKKIVAIKDKTSTLKQSGNHIFTQPEIKTYEPKSAKIGLWVSLGLRKKITEKLDLFSEIRCYQNKSTVSSEVDNSRFEAKEKFISIGLLVGLYF